MSAEMSETPQGNEDDEAADLQRYNNPKYHDCVVIVGNPEKEKVERIGVESKFLTAKSPVFRKMFQDREGPDSDIHITDISPNIFKLIHRYVHVEAVSDITDIEVSKLVSCANKYKISSLLRDVLKVIIPRSSGDLFLALMYVVHGHISDVEDLESLVEKIIQLETDEVMKLFLQLDENCLLYIVKQDALSITEVELWNNVVHWANYQAEKISPTKTVRECLAKILEYMRLLTFTTEEILDHVLPTKILTPEEFLDLILAVKTKQPLETSVLCKVQEKRHIYIETIPENTEFSESYVLRLSDHYCHVKCGYSVVSSLTITPQDSVVLESFICRSPTFEMPKNPLICIITALRTMNGLVDGKEEIRIEVEAGCDEEVILPIRLKSGQPLIMNLHEGWIFNLEFNSPCPVHAAYVLPGSSVSLPPQLGNVAFSQKDIHVLKMHFKLKPNILDT